MSKRLIPFLLFGIALFLIVPPAFAQRLTGSIQGTVNDETGEPLPGVTVEISSPILIGGVKSRRRPGPSTSRPCRPGPTRSGSP
jgi:hypothetical protein